MNTVYGSDPNKHDASNYNCIDYITVGGEVIVKTCFCHWIFHSWDFL